jgi:hypothetical protein
MPALMKVTEARTDRPSTSNGAQAGREGSGSRCRMGEERKKVATTINTHSRRRTGHYAASVTKKSQLPTPTWPF